MAPWSDATLWWAAAGLLVVAELATNTFYLLMLALGAVAGAVAAHAGSGPVGQMVAAAIVGAAAVAGWRLKRQNRGPRLPPAQVRAVNRDIGSHVTVADWNAEGEAEVHYRGARWQARHVGSGAPVPGVHVIRGIDGQTLLLER